MSAESRGRGRRCSTRPAWSVTIVHPETATGSRRGESRGRSGEEGGSGRADHQGGHHGGGPGGPAISGLRHGAEGDAAAGRPRRPDQAGPPDHRRGGAGERDRGDLRRRRPGGRGGLPPALPDLRRQPPRRPTRASAGPRSRPGGWTSWPAGSRFAVQAEPLGYGHAVWCAREFVGGRAVPAAPGRPPLHLQGGAPVRPAVDRPGRSPRGAPSRPSRRPAST